MHDTPQSRFPFCPSACAGLAWHARSLPPSLSTRRASNAACSVESSIISPPRNNLFHASVCFAHGAFMVWVPAPLLDSCSLRAGITFHGIFLPSTGTSQYHIQNGHLSSLFGSEQGMSRHSASYPPKNFFPCLPRSRIFLLPCPQRTTVTRHRCFPSSPDDKRSC